MFPLAQISIPTPTPFPDATVDLPVDIPPISLWSFTDEAIQIWNKGYPLTAVLQIIIVIGLIVGIIMTMVRLFNYVTNDKL